MWNCLTLYCTKLLQGNKHILMYLKEHVGNKGKGGGGGGGWGGISEYLKFERIFESIFESNTLKTQ